MAHRFGRSKLTVILTGVALLVLGIAILVNPIGALQGLVSGLGWILVIVGALTLVSIAIGGKLPPKGQAGDLVAAVVEIALGVVMVAAPAALVECVWTLLGVLVLLTGIGDVVDSGVLEGKDADGSRHVVVARLVSGVLTVALGVAAICMPLLGPVFGMLFAALALILDGIGELVTGARL